MKRSSAAEYVYRMNTALALYRKNSSSEEVIAVLTKQFNVSKSQAYRYLQKALKENQEKEIPERKVVFTVKLHKSQITALRKHAKKANIQLSILLGNIIDAFLKTK